MSTTPSPSIRIRRPASVWAIPAVALVAFVLGLGTWLVLDRTAGDDAAARDATALVDDVSAAWNDGDSAAIPALYADDAVIRSLGDTFAGASAIGEAAAAAPAIGFHVERVAPVTVAGGLATTFVKITGVGIDETPVVTVWQLEDGKVVRQWGFAVGTTAPFDNAVTPREEER